MNCPLLPATGSGGLSLIVAAVAFVAVGLGIVLTVRGRVPRSLPVVVAVMAMCLGAFAVASPADAASDCVTTTSPTTVAVSPSSDVATTTTVAGATTTTAAVATTTTTPSTAPVTTTPVNAFVSCSSATDSVGQEYLFELVDNFGTATVYAAGSGCTGPSFGQAAIGDSNVVDPAEYCATNFPGTTASPASAAGTWTPPIPDGLFGCIPDRPEPTTTTTSSTTTTSTTTTSTTTTTDPPPASFTVGGIISGLAGLLILQNNAFDTVPALLNGPFTFPLLVLEGASYNVTVLVQPPTQTCSVSNGSGTMGAGNVTNVTVDCVFNP